MRVINGSDDKANAREHDSRLEWSSVDWKDMPEAVLKEIDHLLQSRGLEVVAINDQTDAWVIAIDARSDSIERPEENYLKLCSELKHELNRPLPGGRGFQAARDQQIRSLARRLAMAPPPEREH